MQVKSIIFLFALVLAASFGQDTETQISTVPSTVEVTSTSTTTTGNVVTPTGTSAPSTSTTPSTFESSSTFTTSTTTSDVTTSTETSAPSTSTTPSTFESSSTFTTSSSTTEPSSSSTSTSTMETPTTSHVNETASTYVPIPTSGNETTATTSTHGNETTSSTFEPTNVIKTASTHDLTHKNETTSSTFEPTNTTSEAPQPTEKPSKEVKLTFSGDINEVDFIKLIAAVVETNVESINITGWKTVTISGKRDASVIKAVITFFDGKITADDAAHNLVSAYEESKQENGANKFETVAKAQGLPSIQVLNADDGTPTTSSTAEPSHTEEEKKEEGDKMSKGKIAGIVIGSLAGVAVLGGLGYYIYKKRQSKNNYYNLHQYA